jgi:vacuolar protein sorting-associated protein VTA1
VFDAALVGDQASVKPPLRRILAYGSFQNEKIRYAKWKAADIARAFREGRQPVPGPAGGLEEEIALPSLAEHSVPPTLPIEIQAIASDAMDVDAPRGFESATINMGTWSTVATPGIAPANDTTSPSSSVTYMNATVSGQVLGDVVEVNQIRPSEAHAPIGRSESTASIVDGDTSATALIHANANAQALHLPGAPQLYGGDSALSRSDAELAVEDLGVPVSEAGSTPRADGDIRPTSPPSVPAAPVPSRPMPVSSIPPTPSPAPMPEDDIAAAIPMQPTLPLPPGFVPTPGQTVAPLSPAAAVPPPPVLHHQAPGSPIYPHGQPPTPVATAPPPPPELTPQVISRIQKHCRFAISALDYEDDEQARKELRAALDMLGG